MMMMIQTAPRAIFIRFKPISWSTAGIDDGNLEQPVSFPYNLCQLFWGNCWCPVNIFHLPLFDTGPWRWIYCAHWMCMNFKFLILYPADMRMSVSTNWNFSSWNLADASWNGIIYCCCTKLSVMVRTYRSLSLLLSCFFYFTPFIFCSRRLLCAVISVGVSLVISYRAVNESLNSLRTLPPALALLPLPLCSH